jgi:glycosyltransferase involved in cell wall biosynthesis
LQQTRFLNSVPAAVGESHSTTQLSVTVPITIVIPAFNESARIRPVVEALAWADEVIVADGGSADGTQELAGEAGAAVLDARGGTIASQRNAGIAAARNRWILALDADERISEELRDEIAAVVAAPRHEAYRIPFRNFYLGHEICHGRWGNESHVRLFQSNRRFLEKRVHEHLESVSDTGSLNTSIEHSPYRDLAHHLEKMARYARWAAEDLSHRRRRSTFADFTVRPLWRFFREYVIYDGWKDGRAGLLVAALSACSALLKYANLQALDWQTAAKVVPITKPVPLPRQTPEARSEARLASSES